MPGIEDTVLEFVKRYKRLHDGLSPSMREICDNTGVKSTSHAAYILEQLEKDGKVRLMKNGQSRGIIVVGGHWSMRREG